MFSSVYIYIVAQENLMKARDERVALMNEVRLLFDFLRIVNIFLSGVIDLGWNPYAQSMSNAHSFLNTCSNT